MNEYTNLVGYTHTHKVESLNLVWTVSAINMTSNQDMFRWGIPSTRAPCEVNRHGCRTKIIA